MNANTDVLELLDDEEDYDSDATLPPAVNNHLQSDSTSSNEAPRGTSYRSRNLGITLPSVKVEQCWFRRVDRPRDWSMIIVGDTVEMGASLKGTPEFRKGEFLRVKLIIKNLSTDEITLRGWRYTRNLYLEGMLPQKLNEVCLTLDVEEDDIRTPFVQGMVDVPVHDVVRKRKLIMTNQPFPAVSFRDHTSYYTNGDNPKDAKWNVYCTSELVCRWIEVRHFANSNSRHQSRISEGVLRRISETEADTGYGIPLSALLMQWRGALPSSRSTTYTFGDSFCGLGGTSEGAAQAGLRIKWGFDHNKDACDSYALNRPQTYIYPADAHDFLILGDDFFVDIMHLSPPCQPYSPAHTSPGSMDERNQATLFSVAELLKKGRPRVATLEETSGILTHHIEWFHALVNMFTSLGYSVRWRKIDFSTYGLAQRRKRLVIFAACPGNVLPEFPSTTHGPGLHPLTSIQDALRPIEIAANVTHHNPHLKRIVQKAPYDPRTQVRGCITTNGGIGNYHPEGWRDFTIRELACLQSIPVTFKLVTAQTDTTIKRQIGNAVPPRVAKVLFEAVIEALEQQDREHANTIDNA